MTRAASMLSSTPVLYVEAVEDCLPFWERLGFAREVEVPHGARIGFVILARDGVQVMLQSFESGAADVPPLAAEQRRGPTFLFVKVADLEAVESALQGFEVVMPRRTTFYGAIETGFREPGGHCITFAQFDGAG